jgi:hypothetical protein
MRETASSDCDLNLPQNAPSDSPAAAEEILPSTAFLHSQGSGREVNGVSSYLNALVMELNTMQLITINNSAVYSSVDNVSGGLP